jgi:hypothetical protein
MRNQVSKTCAACGNVLDYSTELKVYGGWLGWCEHCRGWQPAALSRLAKQRQQQQRTTDVTPGVVSAHEAQQN